MVFSSSFQDISITFIGHSSVQKEMEEYILHMIARAKQET